MAQVINTNMMALQAQNNLNKSQSSLSTAIQRLSTGLRINSAKDDAAGLGITNRFTASVRGLNQAARNAADGISLAQTAEGALKDMGDNLQRMRELAVQGLNSTNTTADLDSIKKELADRKEEIIRIANDVTFNTRELFTEDKAFRFQVGSEDENIVTIQMKKLDGDTLLLNDIAGLWDTELVENFTGNSTILKKIDDSLEIVNEYRSTLGSTQNRFEAIVNELNSRSNNISASRSRIEDADYAVEVSNMTRAQILQQAGTSVLAQANQVPQTVLSLLQ